VFFDAPVETILHAIPPRTTCRMTSHAAFRFGPEGQK